MYQGEHCPLPQAGTAPSFSVKARWYISEKKVGSKQSELSLPLLRNFWKGSAACTHVPWDWTMQFVKAKCPSTQAQKSWADGLERSGPASREQTFTCKDHAFQQKYEVSLIYISHYWILHFANKAEGSSTHLSNVHDFDGCQLTRFDVATLSNRERTVSTSISSIPSAYTEQNTWTRVPVTGFSPTMLDPYDTS